MKGEAGFGRANLVELGNRVGFKGFHKMVGGSILNKFVIFVF